MVLHVEIEYHGKKFHVDPDQYELVNKMKNFERALVQYLEAWESVEEDVDGTLLVDGKEGVFEKAASEFRHKYRFLFKELLNFWASNICDDEFAQTLMSLLKPQ